MARLTKQSKVRFNCSRNKMAQWLSIETKGTCLGQREVELLVNFLGQLIASSSPNFIVQVRVICLCEDSIIFLEKREDNVHGVDFESPSINNHSRIDRKDLTNVGGVHETWCSRETLLLQTDFSSGVVKEKTIILCSPPTLRSDLR